MDNNSLEELNKAIAEVDETVSDFEITENVDEAYLGSDFEETDFEMSSDLEKAGPTGAGSRGGKIVGHTKSGKPIYAGSKAAEAHKKKMYADKLNPNASDKEKAEARSMRNNRGIKTPDGEHKRYFKFREKEGAMAGKRGEKVYGEAKGSHREQGVHAGGSKDREDLRGQSSAGIQARSKFPGGVERSKETHRKILNEQKEMPKPDLPKDVQKSLEGEQMEELLKTMKLLGPEGLKKAASKLTDAQKAILHEVLVKAKDMSKEANMSDNKKPQKAKEPLTEEKSNSEEGVDEADEKLMNDSNKSQDHQGGSADKPEGWQGQVIKSGDAVEALRDQAKEKIMSMEEKEHGTKDPKKLVEEEKKEHKDKKVMKKSEEEEKAEALEKSEIMHKMVERMRKRGMERTKCLEAMKKKGYDHNMADKMWLDQEAADKVEEAPSVEAVKEEPKKDEPKAEKKMEKSIVWGDPQAAIRANTLGRNFHCSTVDEIMKSHERAEEFKKSNETFQGGMTEVLEKSGVKKSNINDLIAKSMDRSTDQLRDEGSSLIQAKPTVSSFSEEDFLKSWNPADQSKLKKLSSKPEKTDEEKAKDEAEKIAHKKSGDDK